MILERIQKHVNLHRVNATGTEYCGPCPWCAGVDRFLVWPLEAEGKGNFLCRKCGRKGDGIQFLREKENLTYVQACAELNVTQQRNRRLSPVDTSWKRQSLNSQKIIVATISSVSLAIDDIQKDAPTKTSLVTDTIQETPLTTGAAIPDPEVITTLPEPIPFEALTQVIPGYVIDFWDDLVPAAVAQYDCWGGCIHYKHWKDSYLCHQLTGDVDLTASGVRCPVQELPDTRLRLPVLSATGISPEDCQGCHWLGGTLDSRVCISVDVKLKSLGDCPGFEPDRDDWILTTGLEPLPG